MLTALLTGIWKSFSFLENVGDGIFYTFMFVCWPDMRFATKAYRAWIEKSIH